MSSNIVRFSPVRSEVIGGITNAYLPLDVPLDHAMRVLHFINDSNGTYMISFNGVDDNIPVLAESFSLYDLTSDQDGNESFRYENGTQLFVKWIIEPTVDPELSNTLYVVAIYGKGE